MDSGTDLSSLGSSDDEGGLSETALSALASSRALSPPLSSDSEALERDDGSESLDWMRLVGRLARLCRTEDATLLPTEELESTSLPERPASFSVCSPRLGRAQFGLDSQVSGDKRVSPASTVWSTGLEKFLNCVICAELPLEPLLCPSCGVLFCEQCASRWWRATASPASQQRRCVSSALPCPHCRHTVARHELVLARCLRDLLQVMRDCPKTGSQTTPHVLHPPLLRCATHPNESVRYFCGSCDRFICAECCAPIPEGEHRYHRLQRASERIQALALELEEALHPLRARLSHHDAHLRYQEHMSRMLLRQREALSQRIQSFVDGILERVDAQVQTRIRALQVAQHYQCERRNQLRRLVDDIEQSLTAFRRQTAQMNREQSSVIQDSAESLLCLHEEWKQRYALAMEEAPDELAGEHGESRLARSADEGTSLPLQESGYLPLTCELLPPFSYACIPGRVVLFGLCWEIQWLPASRDNRSERYELCSSQRAGTRRKPAQPTALASNSTSPNRLAYSLIELTLARRPGLEDGSSEANLVMECSLAHKNQILWSGLISVGSVNEWRSSIDLQDCLNGCPPGEQWSVEALQLGLRFPDIIQQSHHQARYIAWLEEQYASRLNAGDERCRAK
jgi:hypothetical protein